MSADALTTEVAERRVRFVVNEEVYDLDVIQGAAYLFLDRCYVFLDRPGDRRVEVVLRTKGEADAAALEALAGEFANELLNQALRKNIGASNARIREFLMAKAFFSVDAPSTIDRLLAELDAEEMKEDPLEIPVPWASPEEKSDG
ncbi:MAG: His-Xaa-Ser system protein HxsD [Myxococcota bacterium]